MSISLLRLFFRAHYVVNKYILKMRVSSKELFSTLKTQGSGKRDGGNSYEQKQQLAASASKRPREVWMRD